MRALSGSFRLRGPEEFFWPPLFPGRVAAFSPNWPSQRGEVVVAAKTRHETIERTSRPQALAAAQVEAVALLAVAPHLTLADSKNLPPRRAVLVAPVGEHPSHALGREAQAAELTKGRCGQPVAPIGARTAGATNEKRGEGLVHSLGRAVKTVAPP